MPRLLIILLFCSSLFYTSYGQKPKGKKLKGTVAIKTFDNKQNPFKDTAFLKSLGWTSDYEQIFTAQQIVELNTIMSKFEQETTNEIALITIDSSWTTKEIFDSLILAIAKNWGVGKKAKNNGVLIGISTGLRRIRIQNGYGIEDKLTDFETKKIIDDVILPEFKQGDYFEGAKKGLLAIMQKIR